MSYLRNLIQHKKLDLGSSRPQFAVVCIESCRKLQKVTSPAILCVSPHVTFLQLSLRTTVNKKRFYIIMLDLILKTKNRYCNMYDDFE